MVIKVSPVIRVHRKCGRTRNARALSPKYAVSPHSPQSSIPLSTGRHAPSANSFSALAGHAVGFCCKVLVKVKVR
jgi:hypothetical protein